MGSGLQPQQWLGPHGILVPVGGYRIADYSLVDPAAITDASSLGNAFLLLKLPPSIREVDGG